MPACYSHSRNTPEISKQFRRRGRRPAGVERPGGHKAVITHKVCIYYTNPLETPRRMFLLVLSAKEADWLSPSCS